MKFHILALVLILSLLVAEGVSEKVRKHKKVRRVKKPSVTQTENDSELNDSNMNDEDVFKMLEKDLSSNDDIVEVPADPEMDTGIVDNRVPIVDPCSTVHCGAGRVCEVDDNEEPECVCVESCPVETEPRRKVCSNHNETWTSDCAVYQQRCWCDRGDERCKGEQYRHVHIEYYGECREMPNCSVEEMSDFPRRMRDWLFNIMRDLADRQELPKHYLKMEREAENNYTRRWTNAAIWKWCDLDGHPHDRSVSRHELFPIRAPLMALEHCIAPFLNSCDSNGNHRITLTEWAQCLELDEGEIEDRCEDIEEKYGEQ